MDPNQEDPAMVGHSDEAAELAALRKACDESDDLLSLMDSMVEDVQDRVRSISVGLMMKELKRLAGVRQELRFIRRRIARMKL